MHWQLAPLLGLTLLLPWMGPQIAQGAAPKARVTDDQIQASLKRAVANLRSQLSALDGGAGALVTMALLKSGLPPDTPEIKAGIEKIVKRVYNGEYTPVQHHVYEAGVSLMALANADPEAYKPQITAIAKYLISKQQGSGEWDYPQPVNGDTSITQYAVLGLWEAVRSGVSVPKRVWDKCAAWHISRQLKDGSFTYHPAPPSPDGVTLHQPGTHTMTVAGTASLLVCRLHLYPGASDPDEVRSTARKARGTKYGILIPATGDAEEKEEVASAAPADETSFRPTTRLSAIDKAVGKGKDWLAGHYTIQPKSNHDLYYLYGLERLMALAGTREFDGHDWYDEGAAHLVATENAAGWNDSCGAAPATAFGILFLGKATEKMLGRKPAPRVPKFGGGLLVGGRGLPENLETLTLE